MRSQHFAFTLIVQHQRWATSYVPWSQCNWQESVLEMLSPLKRRWIWRWVELLVTLWHWDIVTLSPWQRKWQEWTNDGSLAAKAQCEMHILTNDNDIVNNDITDVCFTILHSQPCMAVIFLRHELEKRLTAVSSFITSAHQTSNKASIVQDVLECKI